MDSWYLILSSIIDHPPLSSGHHPSLSSIRVIHHPSSVIYHPSAIHVLSTSLSASRHPAYQHHTCIMQHTRWWQPSTTHWHASQVFCVVSFECAHQQVQLFFSVERRRIESLPSIQDHGAQFLVVSVISMLVNMSGLVSWCSISIIRERIVTCSWVCNHWNRALSLGLFRRNCDHQSKQF